MDELFEPRRRWRWGGPRYQTGRPGGGGGGGSSEARRLEEERRRRDAQRQAQQQGGRSGSTRTGQQRRNPDPPPPRPWDHAHAARHMHREPEYRQRYPERLREHTQAEIDSLTLPDVVYGVGSHETGRVYHLISRGQGLASGTYGYERGTWGNHGRYRDAWMAPMSVQDSKAAADLQARYERHNHEWDRAIAEHISPNASRFGDKAAWRAWVPLGNASNPTVREYVDDIAERGRENQRAQALPPHNLTWDEWRRYYLPAIPAPRGSGQHTRYLFELSDMHDLPSWLDEKDLSEMRRLIIEARSIPHDPEPPPASSRRSTPPARTQPRPDVGPTRARAEELERRRNPLRGKPLFGPADPLHPLDELLKTVGSTRRRTTTHHGGAQAFHPELDLDRLSAVLGLDPGMPGKQAGGGQASGTPKKQQRKQQPEPLTPEELRMLKVDDVMYALRTLESGRPGGDYTSVSTIANERGQHASGAYHYMPDTWGNYGGYAEAYLAPPDVQNRKMREDLMERYERYDHDWEKVVAEHLRPVWADDRSQWDVKFSRRNPTVRQYVNRVLSFTRPLIHERQERIRQMNERARQIQEQQRRNPRPSLGPDGKPLPSLPPVRANPPPGRVRGGPNAEGLDEVLLDYGQAPGGVAGSWTPGPFGTVIPDPSFFTLGMGAPNVGGTTGPGGNDLLYRPQVIDPVVGSMPGIRWQGSGLPSFAPNPDLVQSLFGPGGALAEQTGEQLDELKDKYAELRNIAEQFGKGVFQAMTQAVSGTKSFGKALEELGRGFAQKIGASAVNTGVGMMAEALFPHPTQTDPAAQSGAGGGVAGAAVAAGRQSLMGSAGEGLKKLIMGANVAAGPAGFMAGAALAIGGSLLGGLFGGNSREREEEQFRAHLRALKQAQAEQLMNFTIVLPGGPINPNDPAWKEAVSETMRAVAGTRTGRVEFQTRR